MPRWHLPQENVFVGNPSAAYEGQSVLVISLRFCLLFCKRKLWSFGNGLCHMDTDLTYRFCVCLMVHHSRFDRSDGYMKIYCISHQSKTNQFHHGIHKQTQCWHKICVMIMWITKRIYAEGKLPTGFISWISKDMPLKYQHILLTDGNFMITDVLYIFRTTGKTQRLKWITYMMEDCVLNRAWIAKTT